MSNGSELCRELEMTQTLLSVLEEIRRAAESWRDVAGHDALAKTVTSVFNQSAFRGRNDDGNETTATWKANENVNWTQNVDENFRVRFEIEETATGNTDFLPTFVSAAEAIEYNLNGAGWNTINHDGTGTVVKKVASSQFAGPVSATDQMTTSAKTFFGGTLTEVGDSGGNFQPSNLSVQFEYVLQIVGTGVSNGDTLQLRHLRWPNGTGALTALNTYTNTPSITVSKAAAATDNPALDDSADSAPMIAEF